MQTSSKTLLIRLAKFAIPAVIIGVLVSRIEPEQWHQLSAHAIQYPLLLLALLLALTAMTLSFARWNLLVRCQKIELGSIEGFRLGAICYLLSFVSVGSVGGDLFKAVFLAKRRPGKRVAAVASVLVDRAIGLYGLLVVVAIALVLSNPTEKGDETFGLDQIKLATAILVGAGTLVVLFLVLGGKVVDRLITRSKTLPLVGPIIGHIGPPLRMFHSHPIAFGVAVLMSLGVHTLLVISMYLIARGLYGDPPTLSEHFVIVPISLLTTALPITPAGIGLLEAAMEGLYRVVPAVPTRASGTLVALVFEVVKVVMAIIGTIFYWTANDEVRQSLEMAEEEAGNAANASLPSEPSSVAG